MKSLEDISESQSQCPEAKEPFSVEHIMTFPKLEMRKVQDSSVDAGGHIHNLGENDNQIMEPVIQSSLLV